MTGTAPGYDNMHPELLKNLGNLARRWPASLVFRRVGESCQKYGNFATKARKGSKPTS